MAHDRAHWEQLWAKTLRDHPDKRVRVVHGTGVDAVIVAKRL